MGCRSEWWSTLFVIGHIYLCGIAVINMVGDPVGESVVDVSELLILLTTDGRVKKDVVLLFGHGGTEDTER